MSTKPTDLGASTGFRKAYLASMVCIALLTIIGQAVMGSFAGKRNAEAELLQRVHRLAERCGQISRDCTRLKLQVKDEDRALLTAFLLQQATESSREVKQILLSVEDMGGFSSEEVGTLGQHLGDFISNAHRIAVNDPRGSLQQTLRAEEVALRDIDKLSDNYRDRSETELPEWRFMNVTIGILTLLVLIGEYVWIFRPKLLILKNTAVELKALNDRLVEKDEELLAHQHVLEGRNEELVQVNANLEELRERYADVARRMTDIFDGLPHAVFGFNRNGVIEEWNASCERLFGIHAMEATDNTMVDTLAKFVPRVTLSEWQRAPFDGKRVRDTMWELRTEDGMRTISTSVFSVHGHDHRVIGGICINLDVTERVEYEHQLESSMLRINEYSVELEMQKDQLEAANAKLEMLATTDGLTGLKNHRYFQEKLEEGIAKASPGKRPLSLMIMDVDHFKKFNDTYGHPAGDQVLRSIASILSRRAGEKFHPARYGGEEFVAMMPGVSEEEACEFIEDLRAEIEAAYPDGRRVTASFGISSWRPTLRGKGELIARADKALYASKAEGRNRVTVASHLWTDEERAAA